MLTEDEQYLIAMSGASWIRLLRGREERLIARMHGEYRSGKLDQLPAIAELACIRDQIHEINAIIKQVEHKRSTL